MPATVPSVEAISTFVAAMTFAAADSPGRVECTNCSDHTALVGVVLALVALVVSAYSLYLGALRRPKIEVDYVPHAGTLTFAHWSSGVAQGAHLRLKIVVANTGASGTYVERIGLSSDWSPKGSSPLGHLTVDEGVFITSGSDAGGAKAPLAFERGDVKPIELHGEFGMIDGIDSKELARRLHELDAVDVDLEWAYRRAEILRPGRRHAVKKTLTVSVDADRLRRDARRHWDRRGAFAEEARILDEGS